MPFKLKGKNAEGETVEVTVEDNALPEGLTTTEAASQTFEQTFQGRVRRLKNQHKLEFLADEGFQTAALAEWDIDVEGLRAAAAKGEVGPEKIATLRKGWEEEFLAPLQADNASKAETIGGMRASSLSALILEAARAVGVKEEYLTRPSPNSEPMIVASMAGGYGFDEEANGWFERNGGAGEFHFSSNPDKYKTQLRGVGEAFEHWAKTDAAKPLLTPQEQRGPGYTGPGAAPGSVDVVISEEDSHNAETFENAETRAAKQGGKVVIGPQQT